MKSTIVIISLSILFSSCNKEDQQGQFPKLASGTIDRIQDFESKYITPRTVDVWLPEGYNSEENYAVLYMHDGQMLFDSATTWNKQEWKVDEVVSQLIQESKIKKCIVVGVWNIGNERHIDYFPQKPFESLNHSYQEYLYSELSQIFPDSVHSDNYLKFLVKELKPYIDTHYSVLADASNTFVLGSSMGGLISMYAICEYPEVFSGAACISTHWPGTFSTENNPIPDAFASYLEHHLPDPSNHKIYFDYGTETLDSLYEPFQLKVDSVMQSGGYSLTNWETRKFPGQNHSEISWAKRLNIPLMFLMGNSVMSKTQTECMKRILAVDNSLGTIRNHACESIPLSEAIKQYVNSLKQIDFTGCSNQFEQAFKEHETAWLTILEITDKYPDIRGEMHDLFDTLKEGEDGEKFSTLLQSVWDTWREIEKISKG